MLDSRYIHLHEALGLGAMWLKQGAKIIRLPETPHTPHTPITPPTNTLPKNNQRDTMHPSRLAVLKKINSRTLTTPNIPTPTTEKTPDPNTQDYLQQLSGCIPKAQLMAMSVCASPSDVAAGKLLSGEDGVLLQKMLAAINLNLNDVFITSWLKDQPDFRPKPPSETVAAAAPRVAAEWQLCGAKALLLMGDFFERDDVQIHLPTTQTFCIPHPQRILSDPTLKRPTWETLQKLQNHLLSD